MTSDANPERRGPKGEVPIVFETQHRVRFREIDPYGHMNMGHYLTYYIDHRFEGMRLFLGLDLEQIAALPIAFFTRQVTIEYLRPLVADQEFTVRSFIAELGRGQCEVDFSALDAEGRTVSTARMRMGCIDKASGRPTGWPAGLMERFFK